MIYVSAIGLYLGAAFLLGLLGLNRKFGFWGYFFASICLTPAMGALLVIASDRRRWKKIRI